MRAVSVHEDAVVVTSLMWQTTATAIRAGEEAMLIDSPYFPDELELLPTVLAQSGFEPTALLATHGDFDHLLGRIAFPDLSLGVAESTMLRIREKPGEAQRDLRDDDSETYVRAPAARSRSARRSRCRCRASSGWESRSWSCTRPRATRRTGWRSSRRGWGCCAWATTSATWRSRGCTRAARLEDYRGTLARLAPLVERAEVVVPGHGSPHSRERALELLDEDVGYLDALEARRPGQLPAGRDTKAQRSIHAENLSRRG